MYNIERLFPRLAGIRNKVVYYTHAFLSVTKDATIEHANKVFNVIRVRGDAADGYEYKHPSDGNAGDCSSG